MKDWREELFSSRQVPKEYHRKQPHLCNCMAAMRGRWVEGVYMCVRCQKPVYNTIRLAPKK